ncbi:MAG: hypothetical protein JWQ17_1130, partial [Tardiphaga sp.]|nr:hypothetical protein [Tardiphaga sp.]
VPGIWYWPSSTPVAVLIYLHLMSDNPEAARLRKQAEECRLQAEKAVSPLDKEAWVRVAEEWLKLALSTDGRRP